MERQAGPGCDASLLRSNVADNTGGHFSHQVFNAVAGRRRIDCWPLQNVFLE
jgi:hypothetical protein